MIKFKQIFWLLAAFLVLPGILSAQRTITGTVTDTETGETLIGVNIIAKGTATGTSTDFDGTYSLKLTEEVKEIEFSYTGYAEQTIEVGASNILDVQLSAGTILDEVVVIGYGTVKREDATGSIASVGSEDFNRGAITGAQELLNGKIAGVNITTSGDPGGGAQIRIRGGSSLGAGGAINDPLIVIDGVPIENDNVGGGRNVLNVVNPADIETLTVLKDASATAIYGSRASNGVILITTKKGTTGGKLAVNYSGNVSISTPIGTPEVFTGDAFRELVRNRVGVDPNITEADLELLGTENTDWQDQIYQQAIGQDHNVNFGGGVKNLPYRVSLGFTDKNGVLKTDKFTRQTVALNLSPKFLDNRLQFNINHKSTFNQNRFANRGALGGATSFDPTQPILDENSPYRGFFTWTDNDGLPITIATANPVAQVELRDDNSNVQRHLISGSTDYRFGFLPELRANLNLSYDYSKGEGTVVVDSLASFAYNAMPGKGGENNIYEEVSKSKLLEFYLDYKKEFSNDTELEVLGGYSYQTFEFTQGATNINSAGDTSIINGGNANVLVSLYGRANYSLFDRVFLTATLRRDGSSRFSPENRWGLFPAGAIAVKVLNSQNSTPFSSLKVRLGFGITGQENLGRSNSYAYLSTYTVSEETAQYQFGDTFYTTLRPDAYDSSIKWEETTTYNGGIDFSLKGDRLFGSLDFYRRTSKDLLNQTPVPAGTNFRNRIFTNVGSLQNDGVELALSGIAVKGENFTWNIGGNVAYNKNEITQLTLVDSDEFQGILTGGISGGVGNNIQILSVGFPLNSFYVFEQVYDAAGAPIEDEYVDRNNDGEITVLDKYRLEKAAPDFIYGFNTSVTYKQWTLSAAARAKTGQYVYNNVQAGNAYDNLLNSTGYFSNVNTNITLANFQTPRYFSDYFVQKADFFRIDHITLSRNFTNVFNKIKNISVYATVQNPLLVTKYTGIDPELENGIDNSIYPRSRTILVGVNANF
ncbi:MAG: TonB-linked SusC/RagA family outer membrane protein [Saprospiraceae bacterium]|jgi:TonB-linked SusC/RagA family outer membrane protein